MKQVKAGDIFTVAELATARKEYERMRDDRVGAFHDWALEGIVEPAMERIDKATGQENDPSYVAYMLEYLVGLSRL